MSDQAVNKLHAVTGKEPGHLQVVGLQSVDVHEGAAGSKARNLARMMSMGLHVPAGFCVRVEAYQEHVNKIGLERLVRKLARLSPKERTLLLADIRLAIVSLAVSASLRKEISSAYEELGSAKVAVRSSATAEDLYEHSFAGQHGTYFVSGLPAVLRAVRDCWASLWTQRAFDYREQHGFDHLSIGMGAIIQRLVCAEAAGVLFSADPVTGATDRVVIEACYGLGETLVSGKVSPDRIVLAKSGLRTLERVVSEKRVEVLFDDDTGARVKTLPPDLAKKPCIDEMDAQRIAAIGLQIEREFGFPVDIEWAIEGGEIFPLQARSITALGRDKTWEDRQVWSNVNAGEVLPDVATPATWSLVEMSVQPIFAAIFNRIGIDLAGNPMVGQVAGRAYFNLNTIISALRHFPGIRRMDINKALGGQHGEAVRSEEIAVKEEDLPDLKFSPLKLAFRLPGLLRWLLSHSPKSGQAYIEEMKVRNKALRQTDIFSMSDDALIKHFKSCLANRTDIGEILTYSMVGMFLFTEFDRICRKWLGIENAGNYLLQGSGGLDSAQAGLAIKNLAELAHADPGIEKVVLASESFGELCVLIESASGGREFLRAFDNFLAEHGHHSRGEIELYNKRWRERPDFVVDTIKSLLNNGKFRGAVGRMEKKRKANEMAGEWRRRLRNPVKRALFDFYLNKARLGCMVRENGKSEVIRHIAFLRYVLLEIGRRLSEKGVMADENDIFFLRLDEVEPVAAGQAPFDVKMLVRQRRVEYERNLSITPPKVVVGRFDERKFYGGADSGPDRALSGIPVSPGVVTGPARVILRENEYDRVLPGEILVAPYADPGWAPYFIQAAGIVVDMGGLLSHGSIIAREYGIPAVVNVGPATKRIKTGQILEVDGTRGIVKVAEGLDLASPVN